MPFVYSLEAGRYRDIATGRFLAQGAVNRAIDTVISAAGQRVVSFTSQLQTGAITLADWQARMADEMKMLHTGAAAVGRGGWAQMSPSDWGWTGQRLREQYGYLRNFANDIATGRQPMDGRLLARAVMYAEAARSTQREMVRRTGQSIGNERERNQLGAADHCGDCLEATGRGWVPIGTLPAVGDRTCRSRCHCWIETSSGEAA